MSILDIVIDNTPIQVNAISTLPANIFTALPRLAPQIPNGVERPRLIKAIADEMARCGEGVDPASLSLCASNAATLGLYPGPALGHCHFVAFKESGKPLKRASLIIGYRGMMHMAYGTGQLAGCTADIVLEGEECKIWTTSDGPKIHHISSIDRPIGVLDSPRSNEAIIIGAYCVYRTSAGFRGVSRVSGAQLRRIANKQKDAWSNKKENAWSKEPEAMSAKTAVRRASKYWQWMDAGNGDLKTSAVARFFAATMIDEQAERGAPQTQLFGITEQFNSRPQVPAVNLGSYEESPEPLTEEVLVERAGASDIPF